MATSFQVTRAEIRVSFHSGRHFFDFRVTGILPGCRKPVLLSQMPCDQGITFRPLYGYGGAEANTTPEDYLRIVRAASVRKCDIYGDFELTEDVRKMAIRFVEDLATCPAVTGRGMPRGYRPVYDTITLPLE